MTTHAIARTFTRNRDKYVKTLCGRVMHWGDGHFTLWGENCDCKKCRKTQEFGDRYCLELDETPDVSQRATFEYSLDTLWGPASLVIDLGGRRLTYYRGDRLVHLKSYATPKGAVEAAQELTEQTLPRHHNAYREFRQSIYRWLHGKEVRNA